MPSATVHQSCEESRSKNLNCRLCSKPPSSLSKFYWSNEITRVLAWLWVDCRVSWFEHFKPHVVTPADRVGQFWVQQTALVVFHRTG
ncbi:dihydroceramide delta-desaturase [Moniliophthora roreri]|nr:dihydroceramide delta-desaturase [Moniliophthora roreri]